MPSLNVIDETQGILFKHRMLCIYHMIYDVKSTQLYAVRWVYIFLERNYKIWTLVMTVSLWWMKRFPLRHGSYQDSKSNRGEYSWFGNARKIPLVRSYSTHRTNAKRLKIIITDTILMYRFENRILDRNYSCGKDCRSVGLLQAVSKTTSWCPQKKSSYVVGRENLASPSVIFVEKKRMVS